MLLRDETLVAGIKHWISERLYNAEWALVTQLEVISRQFDEMEDDYLRGARRIWAGGRAHPALHEGRGQPRGRTPPPAPTAAGQQQAAAGRWHRCAAGIVANDLARRPTCCSSSAERVRRLRHRRGRQTSHTAIVARSMDIPAVVGARAPPASSCARTTGSSSTATRACSSSIPRPSSWPSTAFASARSSWSASA